MCGDVPQEPLLAGRIDDQDLAARIVVYDDCEALPPFGNGWPSKWWRQTITAGGGYI
jgi:hypothetical protein